MGNARVGATAFWKNQPITVRWSKKQSIPMSNSVLRQARQIMKFEHDNLLPFLGACIEKEHVLMIYEFCNKGTLYVSVTSSAVSKKIGVQHCLMEVKKENFREKHGKLPIPLHGVNYNFPLKQVIHDFYFSFCTW